MILINKAACRICLSTNVKFYHLEAFQLKSYYEEITNEVVTKDDELLHFFCYQCSALLQKYHAFRELCIKSQETLKKISTEDLNVPIEAALKWEQYNNKTYPLIKKLDSTAKLGYFEYNENYITADESYDDPLVKPTFPYAETTNTYLDNEENFEWKFSVGEHNYDYITDGFQECKPILYTNQDSNNDGKPMPSSSDVNHKPRAPRGRKGNPNCRGKKKRMKRPPVKQLDPTKWKTVILSNEEAVKEIEAKIQKQNFVRFKHICQYCQKTFKGIPRFNKHMSLHSESNGNYECFFCKKRYLTKCKLIIHIRLHLEKYHCLQCSQVFCSKFHTTPHETYHAGVQYVCPHCDAKFQKKTTYYGHLRNIHRSGHVCPHCGESFINQLGLQQHKKRAHKSQDAGEEGTYCKVCDMMFENSEAFKEHERNSDKHVTKEEDFHGQSKKMLKRNAQYKECDQCPEQFSSTFLYNNHMQHVHNMPKPVYMPNRCTICEICGSNVLLCQFDMHMDMHKGKLYQCPDCDKSYNRLCNMERHRRLHKNPTPYTCELCGKKFTNNGGRKLHVRTVHFKQPHPPRNRTRTKQASPGKS